MQHFMPMTDDIAGHQPHHITTLKPVLAQAYKAQRAIVGSPQGGVSTSVWCQRCRARPADKQAREHGWLQAHSFRSSGWKHSQHGTIGWQRQQNAAWPRQGIKQAAVADNIAPQAEVSLTHLNWHLDSTIAKPRYSHFHHTRPAGLAPTML